MKYDEVMIESERIDVLYGSKTHKQIWFGEEVAFVRIIDNRISESCNEHNVNACSQCPLERLQNELYLMRFYKIGVEKVLPINDVDRSRNCVCFRWEGKTSTGRAVCTKLIWSHTLHSIPAGRHVVPREDDLKLFRNLVKWRKSAE